MLPTQAGSKGQASFAPVRFVDHPSFHETDAAVRYGPVPDIPKSASPAAGHLSDDATRDLAKRMHYAAFRFSGARTNAEARTWRTRYFQPRDQIILGNRKLIYRAVQMRVRDPQIIEDCASECHLVMIRAVSSYNPWLGIRFSTYAFTCVLRELTRIVQKQFKDRLRQATSFNDDFQLDDVPDAENKDVELDGPEAELELFFASDHALLTDREKEVLSQRFGFNSKGKAATLKDIGSELQISKERVRQLQNSGLEKLREVLQAHRARL